MAAPSPTTLIIGCPDCGTRYRVPADSVGGGRLVKCAKCGTAWSAVAQAEAQRPPEAPPPETDELFDDEAEARLDAAFSEAEPVEDAPASDPGLDEIRKAIAPRPKRPAADPATLRKRIAAFAARQAKTRRSMPRARFRHSARLAALTALIVLLGGGVAWRDAVVELAPDLAGLYEALGMPVNLVGLTFTDVQTLHKLSEGAPVLIVSGVIESASEHEVPVPPVVVTLLSTEGSPVYEWSVVARAGELRPGERVGFETQLTQPPAEAAEVRLSFARARPPSGRPNRAETE